MDLPEELVHKILSFMNNAERDKAYEDYFSQYKNTIYRIKKLSEINTGKYFPIINFKNIYIDTQDVNKKYINLKFECSLTIQVNFDLSIFRHVKKCIVNNNNSLSFPITVKDIYYGDTKPFILPPYLEKLHLCRNFDRNINFVSSLKSLTFGDHFSFTIPYLENLTILNMPMFYDKPLVLPNLKTLKLSTDFNISKFPDSLIKLTIIDVPDKFIIPESVKILVFDLDLGNKEIILNSNLEQVIKNYA
jgi:hypothetical protein